MTKSTEAHIPMDMLEVTPPSGTRMHRLGVDREKGLEINQFGIVSMAHGKIRTFNEKPGESPEYIDGTLLCLMPGGVQVEVARRGLSAEEINIMGNLAVEIDNALHNRTLLSEALASTNNTVDGLRMFGSSTTESGIQASVEEVDVKTEQEIEKATDIVRTLKIKQGELGNRLDSLYIKANDLGVTLITSHTGSTRDGTIPVKLQADAIRDKKSSLVIANLQR